MSLGGIEIGVVGVLGVPGLRERDFWGLSGTLSGGKGGAASTTGVGGR